MPGLSGTNRQSTSHLDRTAAHRKRLLANGNRRGTSRRHPPPPRHVSAAPLLLRIPRQHPSSPHASATLPPLLRTLRRHRRPSRFMQRARLAYGRREAVRRRRHPRPHRRAFDAYARFVLDETASQVTWTRLSARRLLRVGFDGIPSRMDALSTKDLQKKRGRP